MYHRRNMWLFFTSIVKSSTCLLFLCISWSLFWFAKQALFWYWQTLFFLPKSKHEFRSPSISNTPGLLSLNALGMLCDGWHLLIFIGLFLLIFSYNFFLLIFYTTRGIMYRCTYCFLQCCTLFYSSQFFQRWDDIKRRLFDWLDCNKSLYFDCMSITPRKSHTKN